MGRVSIVRSQRLYFSYIEEPDLEIYFLLRKVRDEVRNRPSSGADSIRIPEREPLYFKEPKAEVACDLRAAAVIAVSASPVGNDPLSKPYFQNCFVARRAPSAMAANLAHTTSGSTAAWPTQVP